MHTPPTGSDSDDGGSQTTLYDPFLVAKDSFLDFSYTVRDPPLFPAENAYDRILTLLESHSPWKVTPGLLFHVCRILEENIPFSLLVTPTPSNRTLLPILHKMRTWRLIEGRSLEGLASSLAGLVNELPAPCSVSNNRTEGKFHHGSRGGADKENLSVLLTTSHLRVRMKDSSKPSQHLPSLTDLLGEPIPSYSRHCVACAALRTVSKSSASLQNVQRALHHTHDNYDLAFPRPRPPSSTPHSRSKSKHRTSLTSKVDSHSKRAIIPGPRPVLAPLSGGSRSSARLASEINLQISPSILHFEDEPDFSLSDVWIKRRSQEEGWRP